MAKTIVPWDLLDPDAELLAEYQLTASFGGDVYHGIHGTHPELTLSGSRKSLERLVSDYGLEDILTILD